MKNRIYIHLITLFLLACLLFSGCIPRSGTEMGEAELLPALSEAAVTDVEASSPAALPPQLPEKSITLPATGIERTGLDDLLAQEQAFIDVYTSVNPAVVHIATGNGQGSGFVYDQMGHIITNNHVVQGAQQVLVTFADGSERVAQLVGTDPASDLAVIRLDPTGLPLTPVTLADSEQLQVGQIVIAIGSPFGLAGTMTTGIISGLNRQYPGAASASGGQFLIPDVVQTDAAINPGNSGGPLLDLYGRVIGVNTAIESPVRGSSGIGYAIPANIVDRVVPQLIADGRVDHPWLGIAGGTLTSTTAESLGLPADQQGIVISSVVSGGPADAAGLRGGNQPDVLVSIDGREIREFDDLLGYIVQHTTVGQTVALQIIRDNAQQYISLTLGSRPTN
jgi:2-alkenal reductase